VTLADADVTDWWGRLGIPGLFDVHVHFLPPPVMRKVRAQFDSAGPLIGRAWPLAYRGDDGERVAQLRARRTPILGPALCAPAGHRVIPQRLGGGVQRRRARVPAVRDALPR
jgi:hypothetical protein